MPHIVVNNKMKVAMLFDTLGGKQVKGNNEYSVSSRYLGEIDLSPIRRST